MIPILQTQRSEQELEHYLTSLERIEESNSAVNSPAPCRGSSANVSSPELANESFGVPLEVERYFDVAAQVGTLCFNSDSEILDSECQ